MVMTEAEVEAVVREVTDEEVEHYHEYGWVMLRELVDPAFAAEMLRALYEAGAKEDPPALFPAGHPAKGGLEPFRSFMFSQRMSSNAARLVNRRRLKGVDVPLRYRAEIGPVVKPKGQAPSTEPHGLGGGYHQARSFPLPPHPPTQLSYSFTELARCRTRASTAPTGSASCSSGWRWPRSRRLWAQ